MRRRVLLAAASTALAGCSSLLVPSSSTDVVKSTASVSVGQPDEPYPDCELRIDVDVADDEQVTVSQVDAYGVADSVTVVESAEIVRPALHGATLSVVAVDVEREATSTLFRGTFSGVDEECGVSER